MAIRAKRSTTFSKWFWSETPPWASRRYWHGSLGTSSVWIPRLQSGLSSRLEPSSSNTRVSRLRSGTLPAKNGTFTKIASPFLLIHYLLTHSYMHNVRGFDSMFYLLYICICGGFVSSLSFWFKYQEIGVASDRLNHLKHCWIPLTSHAAFFLWFFGGIAVKISMFCGRNENQISLPDSTLIP